MGSHLPDSGHQFTTDWHIAAACSGHKAVLCRAGAAGLRHLNMSSNLFSGAVPASWANLSRLESVRLDDNALSSSPPGVPTGHARTDHAKRGEQQH